MSTESTHTHISHEHGDPKIYTRNLLALLVLTIITVAAARQDLGALNVVIALGIASIKATLVALFFMHLRWEKKVNSIIAAAGFLFLGVFLMFCLLDVDSRVNLQPVNVKPPVAAPASAAPPAAEEHK
jgi:cytochrome c oxidase subunit 4